MNYRMICHGEKHSKVRFRRKAGMGFCYFGGSGHGTPERYSWAETQREQEKEGRGHAVSCKKSVPDQGVIAALKAPEGDTRLVCWQNSKETDATKTALQRVREVVWGQAMRSLLGYSRELGFYSEWAQIWQQSSEQRNSMNCLVFWKDHSGTVLKIYRRGQTQKQGNVLTGYWTYTSRDAGGLDYAGSMEGRELTRGCSEGMAYRICWLTGCGVWEKKSSQGWLQDFDLNNRKDGIAIIEMGKM